MRIVESTWFRWSVRIALPLYVAALCGPAIFDPDSAFPVISMGELLETERVLDWLRQVGQRELLRLIAFAVLGVLAAWNFATFFAARDEQRTNSVDSVEDPESPPRRCPLSGVFALVLALLATTLVGRIASGWHAMLFEWLPIWIGCLLGVWIGCRVIRGWRSSAQLAVQLLILATGAVICCGWLGFLLIQKTPLDFQSATVSSTEKRRIVELIRNSDRPTASTRHLKLSAHDTNVLLAWGLSIGSEGRTGHVTLGDQRFDTELSIALAPGALAPGALAPGTSVSSFLNVTGAGEVSITSGAVQLRLFELKIGRLTLPHFILQWISQGVVSAIRADTEVTDVLGYVEQLTIRPGSLDLVTRRGFLHHQIHSKLVARLGTRTDVAQATGQYVRKLVAMRPDLPADRDDQFRLLVNTTFQLAAERSQSSDPRLENGSAILALAIVLGHPKVEQVIGNVMDPPTRQQARGLIGRATLRGRADWTRHFWISAAAAVLYGETISDAMGLLKEELDAGRGGSGFSFADLMADMAGTRFGLRATHDDKSAVSVQRHLANDCQFDHLFPTAADLPEGLSDEELQKQFGGMDGSGFQAMVDQIQQRLEKTYSVHWRK